MNELSYKFTPTTRHQGVNKNSIIKMFSHILRHQPVII